MTEKNPTQHPSQRMYLLYGVMFSLIALLLYANWYMWQHIQGIDAQLSKISEEEKEADVETVTSTSTNTERPSLEERAEILGSLKRNPERLSAEERRAILNRL